MSKKTNPKKKVNVKINSGEAIFVAPVEVLQHIAETYYYMSMSCEEAQEKESWLNVSSDIQDWISKTYFDGTVSGEDDEW
jgi:hypothetical protein